jgi:hypothetical protein
MHRFAKRAEIRPVLQIVFKRFDNLLIENGFYEFEYYPEKTRPYRRPGAGFAAVNYSQTYPQNDNDGSLSFFNKTLGSIRKTVSRIACQAHDR